MVVNVKHYCFCYCSVTKSCLTLLQPHWLEPTHQAPLSMGFSRQEYWSGLPFLSPGDLPEPGIKPVYPELAGGFFTTEPPGRVWPGIWTQSGGCLEMFQPEDTKEQVGEGERKNRQVERWAERQKCDGDLAGEVRCSVLGRVVGFLEWWLSWDLEDEKTWTSQRGAGRHCAGGKGFCGGLGMGKNEESSQEAGLTQTLLSLGIFPAWMGLAPACPVPGGPIWHLVSEAASVKRWVVKLLQLVAQVGLPPVVRWWDPGLVAKLLLEQSFS